MDEDRLEEATPVGTADPAIRQHLNQRHMPRPVLSRRLSELRNWFSRTLATRRGRIALGAAVFVGVAGSALVTVLLLGVLSVTDRPVAVPDGSSRPQASAGATDGAPPRAASSFAMTATVADATGVALDTEFILASSEDLPAETVSTLLHVDPTVELSVSRESAGQYRVSAAQALAPGRSYRFVLQEAAQATPQVLASFAFQTTTPVGVVQTIPRNGSSAVPVNTGIELTFSHDRVLDVEGHFRIEPNVPGGFERHGRVIVFVPDTDLAPGTLYTVTLTQGLGVEGSDEAMATDFVMQFETGDTERDGTVPHPVLTFTRKASESATSEAPALEMYSWEVTEATLPVQVYRFGDMQGFIETLEAYEHLPAWATLSRDAFVTELSGLELVASFDAELQGLTPSGKSFIQFPAALPAGFYLVHTEFSERPMQAWLQVTDVATYAAVAKDKTLVWVNDVSTQSPLVGARVEFLGAGVSGETAADGTLTLATPEQSVQATPLGFGYTSTDVRDDLLVTATDGRVAVVPLGSIASYYSGSYWPFGQYAGDDYWHYLSTDRPLYLPSDTIRFWGIARPRDDSGSRTVAVQLTSYSYVGYDYRPVVVAEAEIDTNGIGTFSGELPFAGLSPGSYELAMSVEGRVIGTASVHVQTYTKPAYQISVTPSRSEAFAGEEISFAIDATFLDGTPVPGLALEYTGSADGQVTVDMSGHANVSVIAGTGSEPSTAYLTVTPVSAEEGEIVGEAWVPVYPSSVTAVAQASMDGDQAVITGSVRQVDLARVSEATSEVDWRLLGDPVAGATVTFDITNVSYAETEIGEYYDFIAKIVRKRYSYETVEVPMGSFATVTDANGEFQYAFPIDPTGQFRIDVRVTDGQGRTESQMLFVSGTQSPFNYATGHVYLRTPDSSSTYYGSADQFALGAPVSLAMFRGSEALPSGGMNRYLYFKARDGIREHAVQGEASFQFDFAADDIPNVTVMGVWFNGSTYLEVSYGYPIRFDPAQRDLTIEIAPDREPYQPGDEATLDLRVADANGSPQANTEVSISVVDEAVFLVSGAADLYTRDMLESVYGSVSPGILRTHVSHQLPNDVEAPGLGAGTGGPRSYLADVAFYGTATTDADGRASIRFTLPDNLTSWRVTARGFNDRLMAGTALRKIPVGLPFFADVTLNDEYLVTDHPEIRLRSFGRALQAGAEVTFSVSAPSLGLDAPAQVIAPAFEAARLRLPELREGEHEILIEARSGDLVDSLVRRIRVVPSRLLTAQARFYELAAGVHVEGSATGPTRIAFSDHERGRYLGTLQQLTSGFGDRLDQMLSRDVAAELLSAFYPDLAQAGEEFDASIYQTPEGGIALFPYAGADLALSARAAAIAPDRFGRGALIQHFLSVVQNLGESRERQVIALYGLAALGEPVLVPLQGLLNESDLTWRERLYAGLAFAELGDDTSARQVYDGLINDFGASSPPVYRLRVGNSQDDILEATSLAAILAAGLGDPRAPELFDYTTANYTTDVLVELEQISYLANALPRLTAAPVRFAYTLHGQRTEVALEPGQTLTIQVTSAQLASLMLEPIEGNVGVSSFYTAAVDPSSVQVDPEVTVTRTYGTDPATLQDGALVPITLNVAFGDQALDGCYQLTDVLPSGLRPVVRTHAWGVSGTHYPYRIDGQRVSFCVSDEPSNNTVTYFARVLGTGEFIAEPALIQSMQSAQSLNFSAAQVVIIH